MESLEKKNFNINVHVKSTELHVCACRVSFCRGTSAGTLTSHRGAGAHIAKAFDHDKTGNQSLRVCRVPGEGTLPGSVPVVAAGLGLAGFFGDGEWPKLARSAICMLLLSLSFGGVLLGGLAQELSLGSSLFIGSA